MSVYIYQTILSDQSEKADYSMIAWNTEDALSCLKNKKITKITLNVLTLLSFDVSVIILTDEKVAFPLTKVSKCVERISNGVDPDMKVPQDTI